jgi:glycerone phosphate O-acyltransferase/fatty acyl-CoA reductase
MIVASECMASHCVAAFVLMYRQGITLSRLELKVVWLIEEIIKRGGKVRGFAMHGRKKMVTDAITHLSTAVLMRGSGASAMVEPLISGRNESNNMLLLSQYKNRILHFFFLEGIWACALYAFGGRAPETGVSKTELITEVKFLYALLHREFIWKENPDVPDQLEDTLQLMVGRGLLKVNKEKVELAENGEAHFSFLCSLFWPFIDTYFAAGLVLFSLQPSHTLLEEELLTKTQWLATSMYHEHMLSFYESCSNDSIRNALITLYKWDVITVTVKRDAMKTERRVVVLSEKYKSQETLKVLIDRINRLRKPAPVSQAHNRNLIADIPILAKL